MTTDDTLAALLREEIPVMPTRGEPESSWTEWYDQFAANLRDRGVHVAPSPTGVAPYSDPARGVENEAGRPALPTREAQGGEPTPPGATASSSPLAPSPDAPAACGMCERSADHKSHLPGPFYHHTFEAPDPEACQSCGRPYAAAIARVERLDRPGNRADGRRDALGAPTPPLDEHRYVEVVDADGDDWFGCICGCPLAAKEENDDA